jgi:hypothetical protein
MLLQSETESGYKSHMLNSRNRRNEQKSKRLARINVQLGLPALWNLLDNLIHFLNQTKTARGKEIVMLLEEMLELDEIAKPISSQKPLMAATPGWERDPKQLEIAKRNWILQKKLSKYHLMPHAEVCFGGGGKDPCVWAVWWRDDSESTSEELALTPSQALEAILKIAQVGDLARLRRCTHCQKWLFATFRHQNFCSPKCQQKNYTQSDAWKAHRRAYMHRYYQQNFSGKSR